MILRISALISTRNSVTTMTRSIDVDDKRDGGDFVRIEDEDRGPALEDGEVQTQELGLELLAPEIPGVRMAV